MPRRSQHSWVRGNCIGKGSFGIVHLALDKSSNHVFAVKSVNLKTSSSSHVESLNNEIQILRSLSSPYVVQYLKDDLTHESRTEVYQNLHIEYMPGGTVVDSTSSSSSSSGKKFNDEQIIRSYTRSIVSALNYVHSKGIVHCDVKGKNVLVGSAPGVVKLADFGSAKRISEGCGNNNLGEEGGVMISPQGTPLWMAPEVIRQERQGPESDIWSLGCTVIEMITGRPPWKDCDTTMVFRIGFSDQLPEFPTQLSELGHDFLDKCLRRDPNERWTAEQLLQHPFVSNDTVTEPSPRCVLDWTNSEFHDDDEDIQEEEEEEEEENQLNLNCNSKNSNSGSVDFLVSARDRVRRLACSRRVVWESDGWEAVRSSVSPVVIDRTGDDDSSSSSSSSCDDGAEEMEGTSSEFFNLVQTVVGTTSEYYSNLSNPSRARKETEIPRCFTTTTTAFSCSCSSSCCSKTGFGCKHGRDCKKIILLLNEKSQSFFTKNKPKLTH